MDLCSEPIRTLGCEVEASKRYFAVQILLVLVVSVDVWRLILRFHILGIFQWPPAFTPTVMDGLLQHSSSYKRRHRSYTAYKPSRVCMIISQTIPLLFYLPSVWDYVAFSSCMHLPLSTQTTCNKEQGLVLLHEIRFKECSPVFFSSLTIFVQIVLFVDYFLHWTRLTVYWILRMTLITSKQEDFHKRVETVKHSKLKIIQHFWNFFYFLHWFRCKDCFSSNISKPYLMLTSS